jgi:hypothetical protein
MLNGAWQSGTPAAALAPPNPIPASNNAIEPPTIPLRAIERDTRTAVRRCQVFRPGSHSLIRMRTVQVHGVVVAALLAFEMRAQPVTAQPCPFLIFPSDPALSNLELVRSICAAWERGDLVPCPQTRERSRSRGRRRPREVWRGRSGSGRSPAERMVS